MCILFLFLIERCSRVRPHKNMQIEFSELYLYKYGNVTLAMTYLKNFEVGKT